MTDRVRILHGDNRETLKKLTRESIHAAGCSPPYYSVRDYETHEVHFPAVTFTPAPGLPEITIPEWTGQLGLEPDPWAFIGHLLLTFREVWRVLRNDGTLYVNLGDTYYTGAGGVGDCPGGGAQGRRATKAAAGLKGRHTAPNRGKIAGMKPKNLIGIPWMFAKAMQADGWILRSDIIWNKPNPMPGSQSDRPTTTHEYVFMFAKQGLYFFDSEAIKEEAVYPAGTKGAKGSAERASTAGVNSRPAEYKIYDGMRQKRTVWTIPTRGYKPEGGDKQRHYAVFPPDLVKPCILAGTSERGACPICGAQWGRILEDVTLPVPDQDATADLFGEGPPPATYTTTKTIGWRPSCVCGSAPELGLKADDLETFETPTGEQLGDDLTMIVGRGASKLFEKVGTGKRLITRYEHRKYAEQLRASPARPTMRAEAEVNGKDAFEHYTRTDDHGARPIPPDLLARWIEAGYLQAVAVPSWTYPTPVRPVFLDPFGGTGTTAMVCMENNRDAVICELAEHYLPLIESRVSNTTPALL